MKRIKIGILVVVFFLLMTGCKKDETVVDAFAKKQQTETEKDTIEQKWYVQIDGAVNKPGVYPVTENTRVFEVIALAGGVTNKASLSNINQAAKVEDAQQIHVYTKQEIRKSKSEKGEAGTSKDGKVNLNEADKETLLTLPGIGETKADLIMQYRAENGKFSGIEDIMKIQGIKEGVFRRIKDKICV